VSKCVKDGRWQARIRVGKKVRYLGRFKNELDAALTYDEAALALHGPRAVLNFELSPEAFELAAARAAEKRAKFGFDDPAATPAASDDAAAHSDGGAATSSAGHSPSTSRPSSPWPGASSPRSSSGSFDLAQERMAALSLISLRGDNALAAFSR